MRARQLLAAVALVGLLPTLLTACGNTAIAGADRLHARADFGYTPGADSLSNYFLDPAPASRQPRMTRAQAITAFEHGPFGSTVSEKGARVIARFGLFTGWDVVTKSGTMGPLLTFHGRPAWLIVVSAITNRGSGGPAPAPGHTKAPSTPMAARAFCVVYDDTGTLKEGMDEMGGTDPVIR